MIPIWSGTGQLGAEGNVLLVDKPLGWTSFDVVNKIRMLFHIKKVGHAGTLDPSASGLLIVCTGRQTKNLASFVGMEKTYAGSFELGICTPSFDAETRVSERKSFDAITEGQIREAMAKFVGWQLQVPPMYSAVKYKGKPLYKLARKGKTVQRKPKEVEVMQFEVTRFSPPAVAFKVICSKGTYVRSLVNDLGNELGCGASLTSLRRTQIGPYRVEDAMTMEHVTSMRHTVGSGWNHERRTSTS